jgi:glycosyltransferase involved in cell wall biosynthesis
MININLNAPIGFTGYGVAGLNLLKSLSSDENTKVSLFPIGNVSAQSQEDVEIINQTIKNQDSFDYNADTIKIWHQFDLALRPGRGKYYAFPFFELNLFNEKEKHHLRFPDEIIVASEWAKQIIKDNNIDRPTRVVPLGVDRSIFDPALYEGNSIDNKYIFITIGKWEKRKSHDLILELFSKAFDHNDDVELWMITHNPFLDEQQEKYWLDMVLQNPLRSKIKVFPRIETQHKLANIIHYADCGLFFSRAEGWNLDILETMSMNKPVITTNYSAHTEFCNKDNSMLVDIDALEDAHDGKWFFGFGQWAKIGEPQQEQIIEYMRYVYKNRISTNIEGLETAKKFSWKHSAEKLIRCISD